MRNWFLVTLTLLVLVGVSVSVDVSSVRYLLWTRENKGDDDYYQLIPFDLEDLKASPFKAGLPTYFVYHGWTRYGLEYLIRKGKNDTLSIQDANFISVDWEKMAESPLYYPAVDNMYETAAQDAQIIDWLTDEGYSDPSLIHLVGHSLGAQLAGMVGHYVTSGTIMRVTGLDPAGPSFYGVDANMRIDKTSGAFVDIIHTNACFITGNCRGMAESIGHIDFYPNGGVLQAGCETDDDPESCSHHKAPVYFVDSILSSTAYKAWPCSSWESFEAGSCTDCNLGCHEMGYHTSTSPEGNYYLRTKDTYPFAAGNSQEA